jgi:hypothetical protein
MLTQTRPRKQKPAQQTPQQKAPRFKQKLATTIRKSAWEMTPEEALRVNYLMYEHQNIHE